MRFVTEDELRDAYATTPFDSYDLPDGARLTPGARQFLIDFGVAFEASDAERSERAGAGTPSHAWRGSHATAPCDGLSGLVWDVRLLGAELRLLARRAQGVDNAFARQADALGHAWQDVREAGDLALADASAQSPSPPGPPPAPPLAAGVHPVFFEMARMHAEVGCCAHAWAQARAGASDAEAASLDGWVARAAQACQLLEESMGKAEGKV